MDFIQFTYGKSRFLRQSIMILLYPLLNIVFLFHLSDDVMGFGGSGLKSVERMILMLWFCVFCFGGIVSDSCGPTDTGSGIDDEVLAVFNDLGKNIDLFFQYLKCIDVLVCFNVTVTGSG